ncbi:MAG: SRPBCC family protein [Solirubrobacteraceae bacterium]|nr:SRPBCC family protein [Patulibacter sp.]
MSANEYTVERTTTIDAPASAVYPHLVDLEAWQGWSPWEGLDPDLRRDYSTPSSGVGATYAWEGNRKAGKGRMEITGATEPTEVAVDLVFMAPFKNASKVTFTLVPTGDTTAVTWSMRGPRPLLMRLAGPLLNMDKLVGKDFEKGLAALRSLAEAPARA